MPCIQNADIFYIILMRIESDKMKRHGVQTIRRALLDYESQYATNYGKA
jgi:hypothetical protein